MLRFNTLLPFESYLENLKTQLAEIKITKPKNNLSRNEVKALEELKNNPAINLKKADKGTRVIMNKADKICEANVQLDNRKHYKRLKAPMVKTTQEKVNDLINRLHQGQHIDDITKKWLLQTPNPPRIPIFFTLKKIVMTALVNEYPHLWIHCSSLSHRNKNPLLRIQLISSVS